MSDSARPTAPSAAAARPDPALVVIGNFDGVHRGHLYVLEKAALRARQRGLLLKVLTFDPHPRQIVTGEVVPALTPIERKRSLLEQLDLNVQVVVHPFTKQTAQLTPRAFCEEILVHELNAQVVVVGQNFRFGRARSGDLSTLMELGQELGIVAIAEELQGDLTGVYSSTRVRDLLREGDVQGARAVLGRPHLLSGEVVTGDQRGRTLGFPTANLKGVSEVLPRDGVYAVQVYDLSNGARHLGPGALNLGCRPTVDRPHAAEVHVLDFAGDLYGRRLGVELVAWVRPVLKFADLAHLQRQIATDVAHSAQLLLSSRPADDIAPGFA